MTRVPIVVYGSTYLMCSLLVLSGAHPPSEPNPRLARESLEPRTYSREKPAAKYPSTEERLEADGFLKDRQAESSLERDLTNKLNAIYEHYYELTDKLEQAEGHTRELTRQLIQTNLELANYKVYKHHLINRLKKTEMFLTILLKKSPNDIKELEIDLNESIKEELMEKESYVLEENKDAGSGSAEVNKWRMKEGDKLDETSKNQGPIKSPGILKVGPHFKVKSEFSSIEVVDVGKINNKDNGYLTNVDLSSTDTSVTSEIVAENQNNKIASNKSIVLAQIAFNFLKKKPANVYHPEASISPDGFFDAVSDNVKIVPSAGPVVKNGGVSKRIDCKGVSITDWKFGDSIGNMGLRVFDLVDDEYHTSYQYVRGEPGSAGRPGVPGIAGTAGPNGPAGVPGIAGTVGGAGSYGEPRRGVPGTNGLNGVAGVQGVVGNTGQSGTPGANGATGTKGAKGVRGPMGQQGLKGVVGDPA